MDASIWTGKTMSDKKRLLLQDCWQQTSWSDSAVDMDITEKTAPKIPGHRDMCYHITWPCCESHYSIQTWYSIWLFHIQRNFSINHHQWGTRDIFDSTNWKKSPKAWNWYECDVTNWTYPAYIVVHSFSIFSPTISVRVCVFFFSQ